MFSCLLFICCFVCLLFCFKSYMFSILEAVSIILLISMLLHVLFKTTRTNSLFVLRLNVPVNNFSVMSGRSQLFLGLTSTVACRELMCLAQVHNTVTPVGIEPRTSRFGVRRSITTPPRSLITSHNKTYVRQDYLAEFNQGLC